MFQRSLVLTAASCLSLSDASALQTTSRISVDSAGTQANERSFRPALSSDGRFIAFQSTASNLVAGDTNASIDVFLHDRQTASTVRVSVDSAGAQGNSDSTWPALSADGRYVAFQSFANNLVAGDTNGAHDVFVRDWLRTCYADLDQDGFGDAANLSDGLRFTLCN